MNSLQKLLLVIEHEYLCWRLKKTSDVEDYNKLARKINDLKSEIQFNLDVYEDSYIQDKRYPGDNNVPEFLTFMNNFTKMDKESEFVWHEENYIKPNE
jgi:hypothetical protein